jgi:hypothetical protein
MGVQVQKGEKPVFLMQVHYPFLNCIDWAMILRIRIYITSV